MHANASGAACANLDDVRRSIDAGVVGIVLGSHGGRQLDWTVSAPDLLPAAREIVGYRMALYLTGGVRRGTDLLKALALGADAAPAGRAPLYGVAAAARDWRSRCGRGAELRNASVGQV